MEKKLTDEEIAKAILQSIEYSKTITYFDEWGNCKSIMITDILDLIYRLKAEKEELEKPKFGNWKVKFFKALEENERLTKENERLSDLEFTQEHCDLYEENKYLKDCLVLAKEQAVKDTAKDILDKAIIIDKNTGNNGFICIEALTELCKSKGVEVE